MLKKILFIASITLSNLCLAQIKMDCASSDYSYNANVKKSCEQFQQTTQKARDNLQDKISESVLNVKNMAPPQNTTKQSTPAPASTVPQSSQETEEPMDQSNPTQNSDVPSSTNNGATTQPSNQSPSPNIFKYY